MSMLSLRWRCPAPPIVVRWRGFDDIAAEAVAQTGDPTPIAAIVGPTGPQGEHGAEGPPGPQGEPGQAGIPQYLDGGNF